MKRIKAKPITVDEFSSYGSFTNVLNPRGHYLGDEKSRFYNDSVVIPVFNNVPMAFSPLVIKKPDEMIIKAAEYHTHTGEGILIMDDDAIIHVAPPTAHEPVPDKTEAFIVSKGTFVKLNTAVWHMPPIPINKEVLHVLITLPERVYANDCKIVEYNSDDYIEIKI